MTKLEQAILFAVNAHQGMLRKNGISPFILHPLEAAAVVATMTDDDDVLAAACLHDVLEDTSTTEEQIREAFGDRITELVLSETENRPEGISKSESWLQRKEESLQDLRNAQDPEVKMLWLGDKLSNMRSFYRQFLREGEALWQQFNMKDPEKHYWYYHEILLLTQELSRHAAWQEYRDLINKVFGRES